MNSAIKIGDKSFNSANSLKIQQIIQNNYDRDAVSINLAQQYLNINNATIVSDKLNGIDYIEIDRPFFSDLGHFIISVEQLPIIKFRFDNYSQIEELDEIEYLKMEVIIEFDRTGEKIIKVKNNQELNQLIAQGFKIRALTHKEIQMILNDENQNPFKVLLEKAK